MSIHKWYNATELAQPQAAMRSIYEIDIDRVKTALSVYAESSGYQ
jgi:hypothetical protein